MCPAAGCGGGDAIAVDDDAAAADDDADNDDEEPLPPPKKGRLGEIGLAGTPASEMLFTESVSRRVSQSHLSPLAAAPPPRPATYGQPRRTPPASTNPGQRPAKHFRELPLDERCYTDSNQVLQGGR